MVSTMAARSRTHSASCAVASRATLIIEITSSSKAFMIRAAPQSVCEPRRPLERNATIGRLGGANVAVAQVRGLLGGRCVLVLERREAVLGKGRHFGVVSCLQLDLVEPSRIASEDQLLSGAVGIAERRKSVLLLHFFGDFEPAQRFNLPLRRALPDRVGAPHNVSD